MEEEIAVQLAEAEKKVDEKLNRRAIEHDAAVLWALHLHKGMDEKTLRGFFDFTRSLYLNEDRWRFGRNAVELLKGIGVDIEEWYRENAD